MDKVKTSEPSIRLDHADAICRYIVSCVRGKSSLETDKEHKAVWDVLLYLIRVRLGPVKDKHNAAESNVTEVLTEVRNNPAAGYSISSFVKAANDIADRIKKEAKGPRTEDYPLK